jgi:hypothetical protein
VGGALTPEHLDKGFASVGRGFRVLLWASRGRYAKGEALAFRYA